MPVCHEYAVDQLLVSQCQIGDEPAWEQLQARLRGRAQFVLHRNGADEALVEELTVDTFTVLFLNKRLLNAFPRSGRSLNDFLDYLLRRAVKHYYQVRARHKRREVPLSDAIIAELVAVSLPPGFQDELVQRLTPVEKKYYDWRRWPQADGAAPCPFADPYSRQLKHRIVEKALGVLFGD